MAPETPTERAAVIMARLGKGHAMTIGEIMSVACLSRSGAYTLMYRISRVQPLVLSDGKWQLLDVLRVSTAGV